MLNRTYALLSITSVQRKPLRGGGLVNDCNTFAQRKSNKIQNENFSLFSAHRVYNCKGIAYVGPSMPGGYLKGPSSDQTSLQLEQKPIVGYSKF